MKPPFPCFTETWHNTSYDAISPTRSELSVANKTVIVTGGSRGIGAESARAFAAADASHVVLIGRTQSSLSETAESIQKEFASVSVSTYAADVADEAAMAKAADKFKNWDVLILNAGTLLEPRPVEKTEVTDWWRVFEVQSSPVFAIHHHHHHPPSSSICLLTHLITYLITYLLTIVDQRQRRNGDDARVPPVPKHRRLRRRRQRLFDHASRV